MQNRVSRRSSHARGGVVIEFAFMLPIFIVLLSSLVFLGRIFWHYTVAEKAARDAAAFLARVSIEEIRAPSTGIEVPIAALARAMVWEEIAQLDPGDSSPGVNVLCDGVFCDGLSTPTKISVVVRMSMADPFFVDMLSDFGLGRDFLLTATASTDFVGG